MNKSINKKTNKEQNSSMSESASWIIETSEGMLEIDYGCMESYPCQYHNSQDLDSVKIWRIIKQNPELKQSHPDLWHHFEDYDDSKFDDWNSTIEYSKQR